MKLRTTIPLLLLALAPAAAPAQPAPPAKPAQPASTATSHPADPRLAALLSWTEAIFPWGAGEATIDEVTVVRVPGWRLFRVEKKYVADARMGDATFVAVDDRGQTAILGDAFLDQNRIKLKKPLKAEADLQGLSLQLRRFFPGAFRLVLDPAHDRLPAWRAVAVKLDTGYGEYEVDGFVKADDGALLLLGRAWDRRRPITAQRLEMIDVKGSPSEGPDNARVHVVEFSDMQCAFCKKRTADWEPLLAKLAGQLTIKRTFKFFPLTTEHPWAFRAASAGYCLFTEGGSDLFLRFKKQVYSQQEQLTVPGVDLFALNFANANNIPEPAFRSCYLKDAASQRILSDLTEGFALRVRATPTYFIDGVAVSWFTDDMMEEYLRRTYLKGAGLPLPKTPAAPAAGHK